MLIWFFGYALVALGIILWDAYIGFGFEFPDWDHGPNVVVCAVCWPIALPIILLITFGKVVMSVKERRVEKAKEQRKIRIAAILERDRIIEQIEEEIGHVETESQNATEHARILPGSSSSYVKP